MDCHSRHIQSYLTSHHLLICLAIHPWIHVMADLMSFIPRFTVLKSVIVGNLYLSLCECKCHISESSASLSNCLKATAHTLNIAHVNKFWVVLSVIYSYSHKLRFWIWGSGCLVLLKRAWIVIAVSKQNINVNNVWYCNGSPDDVPDRQLDYLSKSLLTLTTRNIKFLHCCTFVLGIRWPADYIQKVSVIRKGFHFMASS